MYNEIMKLYDLKNKAVGMPQDTVIKVIRTSEINLPKALMEYYLILGKSKAVNASFNRLVAVNKLYFIGSYLVFFEENQDSVLWAISRKDLQQSDPPVYSSSDNGTSWIKDADKVSGFLNGMAFWQAALGGLKYNANKSGIDKNTYNLIIREYNRIDKQNKWDLIQFTGDYTCIINITTDKKGKPGDVFIAANSKKGFNEMSDKLKIDWDYSYDMDK